MEMKGLTGGFYRLSEWVMRLSAINLLWIACSLPVIFLLFAQFVYVSQQPDIVIQSLYEVIAALLLPLIVSPFTLYPATSAMFSMARKWAMGDLDIPLFKSYFRFFKANYKQAMLAGLSFNMLLVVLLVNVQFYADQNQALLSALNWLFLLLLAIVLAGIVNFFCYQAHFEMTFLQLLKNSLLFTIARPVNTIYVLATNGAVLYISLFKFTFLIPFFMGTVAAMVSFWGFLRSMQRIQDKIEKMHQQEEAAASEQQ